MGHVALSVFTVLAFACVALLADLFLNKKVPSIAYTLVNITLIFVIGINSFQFGMPSMQAFTGLMVGDDMSRLLSIFIALCALLTFIYSHRYIKNRNIPEGEFHILGLFAVLGMLVLVGANSLLTLYLGLELLSLPMYAMVAMQRRNGVATEAALKYFVMGAIASGMLLYGISMLYGATGSLNLATIAQTIAGTEQRLLVNFALVFMVAGLGFKFAAAPFHMWAPDVYTGAPNAVTLFLSAAPKVAALGFAFRLLVIALPGVEAQWQQLLIVMAVLSIGIGNLLAIVQDNFKRLLAYSAIGHMGYMLLGFIAGTEAGYAGALFYILIYSLMSVAAFGLIVLMSREGFEAENIDDLKGLNTRSPWLAFLTLLVMLSMAGIPPLVGFFAKLLVLKALVDVHLTWLAVYALLFAVLGTFYYIRVIKTMYFEAPAQDAKPIQVGSLRTMLLSANSLVLLALGLMPGLLWHLCQVATKL